MHTQEQRCVFISANIALTRARDIALIGRRRGGIVAGINRRAGRHQSHRWRWTTVVGQRTQQRIGAVQAACRGQIQRPVRADVLAGIGDSSTGIAAGGAVGDDAVFQFEALAFVEQRSSTFQTIRTILAGFTGETAASAADSACSSGNAVAGESGIDQRDCPVCRIVNAAALAGATIAATPAIATETGQSAGATAAALAPGDRIRHESAIGNDQRAAAVKNSAAKSSASFSAVDAIPVSAAGLAVVADRAGCSVRVESAVHDGDSSVLVENAAAHGCA